MAVARDVTILIPVLRSAKNNQWLEECVTGFPAGTKYLVGENDGDLAGAMNEMLAAADTEWVVPFGHDDVPADDMLDQLLAVSGDADVVYPEMVMTDEELRPVGVFPADVFCGNRLEQWNFVSGGFLGRTSMLRDVGGWRDLDALEDWDVHVRLRRAGARFKACPAARFLYRQVPGSRNKQADGFTSAVGMRTHYREKIVGTPTVKAEATFYFQATPAVSYWRCVVPARALPGIATSDLSCVPRDGGGLEFIDHQGAAVFQFPANNERAAALLGMQADGHRYLVEVDDNYLDEKDDLWRGRAGWSKRIGRESPHSVQGHRWITANADGVIVTTPTLAEIYSKVNPNVYVCRNSIDPSDWPELVKPDDGVFRIGWFASRSHDRDAPLVRKALSWASRQPGVEVVTIGLDPAGWDFRRLHYGWSEDFTGYRRLLMRLDVGVAPIVATSSSVCRSDLKILEHAMAGATTIAQRLAPYEEWFDHPDVLTASTAKDFSDRVRWCVNNRDEVRAMGSRVRDHVLATRTISNEIGEWRKAVNG